MPSLPDSAHAWAARMVTSVAIVLAVISLAAPVAAKPFSAWDEPQKIDEIPGNSTELNTAALDGCPIESPNGSALFMASTRPRFVGDTRTDIDIWVSFRTASESWGDPVNLGEPINSAADDFCPTPVHGKGLFFVSSREGGCGAGDIYFARDNPAHGWTGPMNLGCAINTPAGEAGPSYFQAGGRAYLYFSSGPEIVASEELGNGQFGPATPVAELNSTAGDFRPNVRKDGLEVVFDSNRSDTRGGQDLYVATRSSDAEPWSTPVNLGEVVNTSLNETRPSLSWDARTLYFGRAPGPEGGSDIFRAIRLRE